MPEETAELMSSFRTYWTEKRISDALEAFKDGYDTTSLRLYFRVLMSAEEISRYEQILDFGAGTGSHSHMLSKILPTTRFFCYDIAYYDQSVFNSFSSVMTTPQVSYHDRLASALSPGQLIYSNLVFSHMSRFQLARYLEIFRQNKSDILMIANTLLQQNDKAPHTRIRTNNIGLFDHNYRKFMVDAGYNIVWLYQIEDPADRYKKMTVIYAKVTSY